MSAGVIAGIVIIMIGIVLILGALAFPVVRGRSRRLRERFGPEYDRTVQARDSRHEAEQELVEREKRHEALEIRPLSTATRQQYARDWQTVQSQFVDGPDQAVVQADRLVTALMAERGYPTEGYEQQLADLAVEHAAALEHYRDAHEISVRSTHQEASTEELRSAMVHYRALFTDLLDGGSGSSRPQESRGELGGK